MNHITVKNALHHLLGYAAWLVVLPLYALFVVTLFIVSVYLGITDRTEPAPRKERALIASVSPTLR